MSDGEVGRPVLVTGSHRAGTTWVGRMLALSPYGHYVHEPFAPMNHRSWLAQIPEVRYLYLDPDVAGPWSEDLQRMVALSPPWGSVLKRARSLRDLIRVGEDVVRTGIARRRGARAIIKDPFAMMSAGWVAAQSQAAVVVLLRHPAAFVSSVLRLGWRLDERWLMQQPQLMSGMLAPFEAELATASSLDPLDHACLTWRVMARVARCHATEHPDWAVVPYELLALDVDSGFQDLYDYCGLPWNDRVRNQIMKANGARNPSEVDQDSKGGTQRDSRQAIWTWKNRLTDKQITHVRRQVASELEGWYDDPFWW